DLPRLLTGKQLLHARKVLGGHQLAEGERHLVHALDIDGLSGRFDDERRDRRHDRSESIDDPLYLRIVGGDSVQGLEGEVRMRDAYATSVHRTDRNQIAKVSVGAVLLDVLTHGYGPRHRPGESGRLAREVAPFGVGRGLRGWRRWPLGRHGRGPAAAARG